MKNQPGFLKLYVEDKTSTKAPQAQDWPGMATMCEEFAKATGWSLRYVPADDELDDSRWDSLPRGEAPGKLLAEPLPPPAPTKPTAKGKKARRPKAPPRLDRQQVQALVGGLNGLVAELHRTRVALWKREAELAAGVPVTSGDDEREQLANRLDGVLRGGAEAVGCQASALYMLDESTSELKLRSCWGLPKERLIEPARNLRSSIADLEALLGNAVVLEDTSLLPHWKTPENFPAAVCVPVSSPTMPLGTMWVFSREPRTFSSEQTNMLEIVAGRVAAELERAVLLRESAQAQRPDREAQRMVRWQRSRLPQVAPMLEGWSMAGWSTQMERVGGDFFDWNVLGSGNVSLAVGAADGVATESSLTAAALHSALRAHAASTENTKQLLLRLNDTFWTSSSGEQTGSLAVATLAPETGELTFSLTGRVGALIFPPGNSKLILPNKATLGADPDAAFSMHRHKMGTGESAILFSVPTRQTVHSQSPLAMLLAETVRTHRRLRPQMLVEKLRDSLQKLKLDSDSNLTFLIVKRCR